MNRPEKYEIFVCFVDISYLISMAIVFLSYFHPGFLVYAEFTFSKRWRIIAGEGRNSVWIH